MAVTQGPIFGRPSNEKVTNAAWKTKPSWYVVAEKDRMNPKPDVERAMARKINAQVTSLPTSHVPWLSRPKDVAAVILAAAGKSISKVAVSARGMSVEGEQPVPAELANRIASTQRSPYDEIKPRSCDRYSVDRSDFSLGTWSAQQRPAIAEQIAKTYGLDSWDQVEAIRYTFNVDWPGA